MSQHFSEVFKELVPNGYGRMVMKTTTDRNDGEEGLSQEAKEPISVNEFVGVQIQVSFTGQGDRYLMQQLSGNTNSDNSSGNNDKRYVKVCQSRKILIRHDYHHMYIDIP